MGKYTFRIISPKSSKQQKDFNEILDCKNAIFLAGPCPRGDYETDWRYDAYDYLNKKKFNGVVINPTNDMYNDKDADELKKQTEWEHVGMSKASSIVFWVDRTEEHPAMTTNVEFGEWFQKNHISIGFPTDYKTNKYMKLRCKMLGIKYFKTLEDTLDNALESIGFNAKNDTFTTYFTSDTHFSQERTLEFSKRPFISTDEMDLAMISNWNKKVTMNDDVFHAGDLGDLDKIRDIIGCLNFRTLTIIPGNYERKEYDKFKKAVKGLRNVTIEENGFGFTEKESNFYIVHEPLTPALENADTKFGKDNYCVLFGHTHNRGNVKRNGINIGTDCWGFTPISIDEVLWLDNARKNFWDENVFTPVCLTTADN